MTVPICNESNPTAFLSYRWESDKLKGWVKALATRLRSDGVIAVLDQWSLVPGDQLPEFMERAIRENDFVLVVCTPGYKVASDRRTGGVGYEGDIITAEMLRFGNQRKFIPILRYGDWESASPSWALGKWGLDFRSDPVREQEYKVLIDTLHRRNEAPPVVALSPRSRRLDLTRDCPTVEFTNKDVE